MSVVDYARIAETYDALPVRHAFDAEPTLLAAAAQAGETPLDVLDVGCGTGLWLAYHAALPELARARLAGCDPSPEMLARARARLPGADLRVGVAEALPFNTASADFVAMRFCHHHFDDVPAAFAEVRRVLRPAGRLLLVNLEPERMPGHWIQRCFPAAAALNARYAPVPDLVAALTARGFVVSVERRETKGELRLDEALRQARLRDQTHLAALADADWREGLAALTEAARATPEATLPTESCVVTLRAQT
jgi:ubiquinone/menaquinone biosynthesis C-methylase UbiE